MEATIAKPKRITLATFKSYVRKNWERLEIRVSSSFDGMTDCVEHRGHASFRPITAPEPGFIMSNNLGIQGAWLVLGGRDYFSAVESETHEGIHVYNCCGWFDLAVRKSN